MMLLCCWSLINNFISLHVDTNVKTHLFMLMDHILYLDMNDSNLTSTLAHSDHTEHCAFNKLLVTDRCWTFCIAVTHSWVKESILGLSKFCLTLTRRDKPLCHTLLGQTVKVFLTASVTYKNWKITVMFWSKRNTVNDYDFVVYKCWNSAAILTNPEVEMPPLLWRHFTSTPTFDS